MAQNCLKCLKYIMCAVNFLFFISGATMLGFGVYMIRFQAVSLLPSVKFMTAANLLLIAGIIVTCVSFLGFIGALKENRCFLLTFFILLLILMLVELAVACILLIYDEAFGCCGVNKSSDWGGSVPKSCCLDKPCSTPPAYYEKGCLIVLRESLERNYLTTGIAVIGLCVMEVLGMCIAMTLFCHISSSGLSYKL